MTQVATARYAGSKAKAGRITRILPMTLGAGRKAGSERSQIIKSGAERFAGATRMTDYQKELAEEARKMRVIAWLARKLVQRLEAGIGDWDVDRELASDIRWLMPMVERHETTAEWTAQLAASSTEY